MPAEKMSFISTSSFGTVTKLQLLRVLSDNAKPIVDTMAAARVSHPYGRELGSKDEEREREFVS
jgi:hypothetical protein